MPIELDALQTFVRVAELASFTRAGEQLGLSKSRTSLRVSTLEEELGTQLLTRSTRAVQLTPDGEQFLVRARRLLADAEELGSLFQATRSLSGKVRLDLPISLARSVIIPRVPELIALHPRLELIISTTDQRVDVLRDGFDCVLRIGSLDDSGLVARKLGTLPMMNCASPSYLSSHGTPRTVADLAQHLVVHYSLRFGSDAPSFDYFDGASERAVPMRSVITVNNTDAYRAACLAGLGIVQVPRFGVREAIAAGTMVEVLPDLRPEPMLVSLVHTRSVPKRIRVVMTWLARLLEAHLAPL